MLFVWIKSVVSLEFPLAVLRQFFPFQFQTRTRQIIHYEINTENAYIDLGQIRFFKLFLYLLHKELNIESLNYFLHGSFEVCKVSSLRLWPQHFINKKD